MQITLTSETVVELNITNADTHQLHPQLFFDCSIQEKFSESDRKLDRKCGYVWISVKVQGMSVAKQELTYTCTRQCQEQQLNGKRVEAMVKADLAN